MEGEGVHGHHQGENVSFTADVLPDLELKDLPITIKGVLRERIDRHDLVEKIAVGDGNCLFRALTKVLKKKQKHHMGMRKELVQEMTNNKDMYMDFALAIDPDVYVHFDEYLEDMSKEGTWGDLICLKAAANLFHVRIILIRSANLEVAYEIAPTDRKSKKDIFLSGLYVNEDYAHCNPLFPRKEVPAVDSRSPSPSDRRVFVRSHKVLVENLPSSMTVDDLIEKVSGYGEVLCATIEGGGCGYVTMADKESVENAIGGINGQVWDGMEVKLQEVEGSGSLLLMSVSGSLLSGSPYDYIYDHDLAEFTHV